MSSVCYSPLKNRFMLTKAQDHRDHRRDSFEIDVFEASSYYSGFNIDRGYRDTSKKDDGVRKGNNENYRIWRHSINAVMHSYEEPQKQEKKRRYKKQPSSPGAKLASYLNALFNQSLVSKHKKKATLSDEDEKSRSSSSMSLARSEKMAADSASMYSHSTYTSYTRPTPTSAHPRRPAYKDLRSYSSYSSKQVLQEEKAGTGGSAALAWFDQELKLQKKETQGHSHQVLKNNLREDEDDEESDSSSDLFELQNYDLGRHSSGELPVHGTTKYQH